MAASEAVAFEGSPSAIASSVAAGVPTVGVVSTHDPEKLKNTGALSVVPDFDDPSLRALLDSR